MYCPACGAEHDGSGLCPNCRDRAAVSKRVQELHGKLKDEYIKLRLMESKFSGALEKVHGHLDELGVLLAGGGRPGARPVAPDTAARSFEEHQTPARDAGMDLGGQEPPRRPSAHPYQPTQPATPVQPVPQPAVQRRDDAELEIRLGQKVLLVVGIVTMVFGVGFFLKYSFDQGWIPPAGRVALAYLWGLSFLGGGEMFRRKGYEHYGLSLVGGGVAVLYFATWAGFQYYHLMGQAPAFGLMILTTALAMTLSVRYDTRGLAVLGTVGGFLTPLLLSTGTDNQVALMTYMAVLNGGILWVAFFKRWEVLNWIGMVATFLLFLGWMGQYHDCATFWPSIFFLNVYTCGYVVIPYLYDLGSSRERPISGAHLALAGSFIGLALNIFLIDDCYNFEAASIASLGYAALFAALAQALYMSGRSDRMAFILYVCQSALFTAVSIPLVLDGEWVTVTLAIQAAALLFLSGRLSIRVLTVGGMCLMAFVLLKFFVYDYSELYKVVGSMSLDRATGHGARLMSDLFILAGLFAMGRWSWDTPFEDENVRRNLAATHYVAFGAMLFIVLSMEAAIWCAQSMPDALRPTLSVLWTLFSAVLMGLGFRKRSTAMRITAIALFGITVLKVFFVDMAEVSTPWRIVSFIILGLLLVGCSFLYYRFKDSIMDSLGSEGEEEHEA